MKKTLLVCFIVAIEVCSCQVKEEVEFAPDGKVFTATMEAIVDDAGDVATKTSIDANGNVLWKRGDQVSIFAGTIINGQYQVTDDSDGKTAAALNRVHPDFISGSEIGNNVAMYPYYPSASIEKMGSAYLIKNIVLPAAQTYANGSFGNGAFPMTAVTSSTRDINLKFKNVLGGLKLQLKGTATISSISMTGNNNEKICGAASVIVSNSAAPAITLTDATATTVTLDCGDGVELNANTATAFIIALPPSKMTNGFTVTVTDSEGRVMEIQTTKSQSIARSNILSMPTVIFKGQYVGPQYIDLGLPSGLKWATCNVGANAPEEPGDYFAWGETEPHYSSQNPFTWIDNKEGYEWTKYEFRTSGDYWDNVKFSKYNTSISYGPVDNKTVLESEDDAAHVNRGGAWRMPTDAEWTELRTECNWTWTTQNGVNGMLVTSNINNNSIFLPAAGHWYTSLDNFGSLGDYRSSSLRTEYPNDAWLVTFDADGVYRHYGLRCDGFSVRAITDEDVRITVTGISLSKSNYDLVAGETVSIVATVTPSNATQSTVIWSSSDTDVATVDYSGVITAVQSGTAIITATTYDGGFYETCTITVAPSIGSENGHYWVDLGLPSGIKWATCNVGASTPEAGGGYYAWGETVTKTSYTWNNYSLCRGSNRSMTKYCNFSSFGKLDCITKLELEDDAAYVNWGGNWRMPTRTEMAELINNCTWAWETEGDVNGYRVTSKTNGNSIFLPASGSRDDASASNSTSIQGYYWTSSLDTDFPSRAWYLIFGSSSVTVYSNHGSYGDRYNGRSVRPVLMIN
ncbi:MAG: Ig-like domain-containing protein [Bacteroidales bacterium]|nr:Ig-like domain-containing protein [Bacteroidales bacterium]